MELALCFWFTIVLRASMKKAKFDLKSEADKARGTMKALGKSMKALHKFTNEVGRVTEKITIEFQEQHGFHAVPARHVR